MILTPHLLVGAAIASKVPFAPLGLALAFLSHYILDLLPQYEYSIENMKVGRWRKTLPEFLNVLLDISLGFILIFIFGKNYPFLFIAGFLAILPDGLTLLYFIFPKNKILAKHRLYHQRINLISENKKIPVFWGIFSEVLITIAALISL